jgi:predicted XRE-type DNA-binding protein
MSAVGSGVRDIRVGNRQARVSDIKRGKFGQFSLDMLVGIAGRDSSQG